ncbi:MAG: hypothetical protein A2X51_10115 [Candidatus Rokubacteria bacterium GWC2_70_24]|nr:MAG: hypothetical protein A2X53_13195 [Candidatus Rokubacteria bacterium GWA2_70_23]OGK86067.1 MAG: hypothetical protein A2X51_10115 [Candidatus Rokubacteria bacterium GWC2_70_24]OGK89635.1 MAG: hypothetical protein A2X50_08685 [Candidatus Rokubacteria bacterium GWF2_70_14]HAM56496.1 hypothetical protein [Candidatus Rokubacteria bacterium]
MPVRAHRPLADVRTGTRIFIDANIFVYHLATMQRLGITALASNDSDFGRVQAITVYRPTEAGT